MAAPVELSIVLLSYNRIELTRKAVANILHDTRFVDFELVVVDNSSVDGTADFLRTLNDPRVRTVRLETNRYFGGGNNAGIKECRGKYILLTQNDMTFAAHSLGALLDVAPRLPDAGCIGIGGGFLNRRGVISEVSDWWLNPIRRFEYIPVDFVSGCCMLFEREFMQAHGIRFDEKYQLYWEDVDICHQVACARKACYMVHNGLIGTRHLRSATITPLLGVEEREQIRAASEAYFRDKWKSFYEDPGNLVSSIQYRSVNRAMRLVPAHVHDGFIPEVILEHQSDAEEVAPFERLEMDQDYEGAIAGYKEIVRRNPNNVMAYRNLCTAVSRSGSAAWRDDVVPVKAFLHRRPPVVLPAQLSEMIEPEISRIADKLAEEGSLREALEFYQELYEIAQNSRTIAVCELQIAKLKYRTGHVPEAERRLTEWLLKNERRDLSDNYFSSAHFYLGEIALSKKDYSTAGDHFAAVLAIDSTHRLAAERLQEIAARKGK